MTVQMRRKILQQFRPGSASGRCRSSWCRSGLRCFAGADFLVAADCTAYAYGNFHQDFIRDHVVLVGCTKLDDIDYSEKLARIFMRNDIKSITVARMEVPCCAGMERAVKMALKESGKKIPVKTVVISTDGEIL